MIEIKTEEELSQMSLKDLALIYKQAKAAKAAMDQATNEIDGYIDLLSLKVILDKMEDEGLDIVTIKDVGRLQIKDDIYCSVLAAKKDDLKTWLKASGNGSLIKEEVNASTLKAFIKGLIADDIGYPDDVIKVTPYSRVQIVKK